jgi:hypothetical protein
MMSDACFEQHDDHCHNEDAPEHQHSDGHPEIADALEAVNQQIQPVAVPAAPIFDFVPSFISASISPYSLEWKTRLAAPEEPPPSVGILHSVVLLI